LTPVASWDGVNWSTLASGLDAGASELIAFDSGQGAELYVGGSFLTAGGEDSARIARWSCPGSLSPDLGVALEGPQSSVPAGFTAAYRLTVENTRTVDVPRSTLEVTIPPQLKCSWSSFGTGGASGYSQTTAARLGGPAGPDILVLPAGAEVAYTFTCRVDDDADGPLDLTASIAAPLDGDASNNQATVSITALATLFADDFESGDSSRWGATVP